MTDKTEVLIQFCQQEWAQARQSEEQKATLTNIILVVASATVGFIAQNGLTTSMLSLSIPLILLGIYGAVASEKLYERHQYHVERARSLRQEITMANPEIDLDDFRKLAWEAHKRKFPTLHKLRLHYIWLTLHIIISLIGISLTIAIIF